MQDRASRQRREEAGRREAKLAELAESLLTTAPKPGRAAARADEMAQVRERVGELTELLAESRERLMQAGWGEEAAESLAHAMIRAHTQ